MTKPTIATLSLDIKYIRDVIDEVKNNTLTKEVVELKFAEVQRDIVQAQTDIKSLEVKLLSVEKAKVKQTWITGTLSAIAGSVLTFLVLYFLQDIVGK